jgi:hypothetical protein
MNDQNEPGRLTMKILLTLLCAIVGAVVFWFLFR